MVLSKRVIVVSITIVSVAAMFAVVRWRDRTVRRPSPPFVDRPRLAAGVEMSDVTFFSDSLHREVHYRVFAPSGGVDRKLPVVYLLHGGGGDYRDWSNYSDVAQFAARGLLLVMPQGDYSYYVNSAQRPQDRYEDYILNDLSADVGHRFPVREDRNGRAIVGVSMGGFGAINLALRHPERFAFAGAVSPAVDVARRSFSWRRADQSRHFREIFGEEKSDSRRKNDPFVLVRMADASSLPYFYVACGLSESLLAPNRELAGLLDRYGIAHEFHAVPGGHEWNQWNTQLETLFDALAKHLR